MIDTLLSYIAPHLCYGCGQTGTVLCDSCMNNIDNEQLGQCIVCPRPARRHLCSKHVGMIDDGWYGAMRVGVVEQLIDAYKFENVKAAATPLTQILLVNLPALPDRTVIVPIPTIASHIRQRGYDHMSLVARDVVRIRKLTLIPLLQRNTSTTQRDADRRLREKQAQEAFRVVGDIDPDRPYLIIDDIATTGATLRHAAETLRRAGARTIWVAAVARQPLD